MLENLIFSLNATMPIFLMMVVGYILKKIKMLDAGSTAVINRIVFRVFLPALLINDMVKQDFVSIWDGQFVMFCFLSTIASILISAILAKFFCKKAVIGEFIQGSFRSAAATLGIAFMTNVYDNVAMVALMIIGCVPIYNILSVFILSVTGDDFQSKGKSQDSSDISALTNESGQNNKTNSIVIKTIKSIATNPIILSIVVGALWSLLKLPQPKIIFRGIEYLANVASPLALIGLGASFEFKNLRDHLKPVLAVSFNKLVLFVVLFMPVCIWLGFRDEKIVAALIMLGSATTSSAFIMAKNMGHEGKLSACVVMITTLLSSFTLTLWLFILKTMCMI